MRWPIRNQILVPFLFIQIATILAVALSSGWFAIRQVDDEVATRLENVMETLEKASYPLTSNILEQLNNLTGAEFVVYNFNGQQTASTLKDFALTTEEQQSIPSPEQNFQFLRSQGTLPFAGEQFLAGKATLQSNRGTVLVLYPKSALEAARWEAIVNPALVGGSLLLLTPLASFWISKRLARRIQDVQQHVSRIAGGDLTPMPILKSRDELRELSQSVNRMTVVLDQSMKRIQESERSAMLTQLVGGLAHQLRNSLTGARVSIQLHQRHCSTGEEEAIEVALKQLTLTEEQIKALLRLSRGESEVARSGDVAVILDDAISLVRPLCIHQKIDLIYNRENFDCLVEDQDAIRGALLNLLMNAIEATPRNGEVFVQTHSTGDQITIDVVDDGPGVSSDHLDKVFTPFFTTKPEGAGLGLALARQAAEDCNGTLTIIQQEKSTFRLSLPQLKDRAASAELANNNQTSASS